MSAILADQEPFLPGQQPSPASDDEAIQAQVLQALSQSPREPACWMQLGRLLERRGELGEAVEAYLEASSLAPDDPQSRTALGHLFRYLSMPDEAIHWHGEALVRQPQELILRLNHLFVHPIIPRSAEQLIQLRQRCLEGLEELLAQQGALSYGIYAATAHTFPLIYHNCNDRIPLEGYGRLIQGLSRTLIGKDSAWQPASPSQGRTRKRIGFVSGYLSNHSNSLAFEGLIRHFDRSRFEVVVIHLHDSKRDGVQERINSHADQVVVLGNRLAPSLKQLRSLDLDLLYYTDIGMHFYATLLACARSAPVQISGWGIPQTTGLNSIDYYVSVALAEPQDADQHYSEQLVRLPGLPSCYLSSNLPRLEKDRDYFFLPSDSLLLGCLQSLRKLHPDFDAMLEQIAQRLPEAWFVMVEAKIPSYTQILLDRFQRQAPTFWQRLILLSHQNRSEYISLAGCMDLLLDPPYFSSGVTLYDTLHTGTPIVCVEGAFLRSRHSAAAYRLIGVEDPPVATDLEHYVELVVALAQDGPRRAALRNEIRARATAHLYDRLDGVEAFEAFALEAIACRKPCQNH